MKLTQHTNWKYKLFITKHIIFNFKAKKKYQKKATKGPVMQEVDRLLKKKPGPLPRFLQLV